MEKHIASLSYGKDSLRMVDVLIERGDPLDEIITVDVWASEFLSACLPEVEDFKGVCDGIIKERYGYTVHHICALDKGGRALTFEDLFYRRRHRSRIEGIRGFPRTLGCWVNSALKLEPLKKYYKSLGGRVVEYIGIAANEGERIARFEGRADKRMPLVEQGITEADCMRWCAERGLLSPVYKNHYRDGCWFCPSQNYDSLRALRKGHPELWKLLLEWDAVSPTNFRPGSRWGGKRVQEFEKRFAMEEAGYEPAGRGSVWRQDGPWQATIFGYLEEHHD